MFFLLFFYPIYISPYFTYANRIIHFKSNVQDKNKRSYLIGERDC